MRRKPYRQIFKSCKGITTKKQIKGTKIEEYMKHKEKELGYKCKKIFDKDEYIFGEFDDGTEDRLIVTLGYAEKLLHNMYLPMNFGK